MLRYTMGILFGLVIAATPVYAQETPSAPAEETPPASVEEVPPAPAPAPAPADETRPAQGEEVRFSVGLGESLGLAGLVSAQIYDRERFGDAYLVVGSTMMIINGVGVGWQHRFWDRVITPFVNGTGFAMIGLPAMCSGDHCRIKVFPVAGASAGFEWRTNHLSGKPGLHLQVGLASMVMYDSNGLRVLDSPSDNPYIWPVLNVGWTRYF